MARPRLNQFADDLGITRSSAKKLMKKARGRKDGGSETLEKYMSDKKYTGPLPKSKPAKSTNKKTGATRGAGDDAEYMRKAAEANKAKDGKYMSCGGMRKALGGGKFTGVY